MTKGKVRAAPARPRLTAQDKQWQAQDDLRTLQRAQEIQTSKVRLSAAQAEAKAQMQALAKVKGKA